MNIDRSKRIFGLDLMRAIAISGVLFTHLFWVFPDAPSYLQQLSSVSGFMGVEIFFVLSGFLIGRLLYRIFTRPDNHPGHWLYFLFRRWFRTLPNYYLVLLVNILIVVYLGRDLPDTLGRYFFFLQNAWSGMDIFFTESWSLPIEEFAYIIGPLVLFMASAIWRKRNSSIAFLVSTVLIILLFTLNRVAYNFNEPELTAEGWNIELKAVVLYRIDAIYYGVLFAWWSINRPGSWRRMQVPGSVVGTLIFLGVMLSGLDPKNAPLFANVFYLPLCSLSVAMWLPALSLWKKAPDWFARPITLLSVISYSVYLLHYSVVLQLMRYWVPPSQGAFYASLYTLLYLVLTLTLAYLLYRFYEKPLMDIRDKAFFRRFETRGTDKLVE